MERERIYIIIGKPIRAFDEPEVVLGVRGSREEAEARVKEIEQYGTRSCYFEGWEIPSDSPFEPFWEIPWR